MWEITGQAKLSNACLNPHKSHTHLKLWETVGCQSAGDREQKTLIQVLLVLVSFSLF